MDNFSESTPAENNTGTFTSEADEAFFGAIGRLTISWGHLELGLDCMVHILYHGFKGNTIEREIPRNLQRKITFLRSFWQKLQAVGIDEEERAAGVNGYMKLLNRIQTAAQTRHDIIHGVVIEQVEHSGEATMIRLIRSRDGIENRKFQVTTEDILRAALEAQDLGGRVLFWVDEVNRFIQNLLQESADKVAVTDN